jgi:hypothetical protein
MSQMLEDTDAASDAAGITVTIEHSPLCPLVRYPPAVKLSAIFGAEPSVLGGEAKRPGLPYTIRVAVRQENLRALKTASKIPENAQATGQRERWQGQIRQAWLL